MDAKTHQNSASTFLSSDRIASLSDTIFGVAMTLLATTLLPSVAMLKGSILDMLRDISGQLTTVILGFFVGGSYWVVQQRRLTMTVLVTPRQTLLHLTFLFLIVLLPISTDLWGRLGAVRAPVMVYGAHLTLIALVNLLLWFDVHRNILVHAQIVRSSIALALFLVSLAAGSIWPSIAPYLWFAVFATSLLNRNLTRHLYEG